MSTPRKAKWFWAITDSHLIKWVHGWECETDGYWWVPELGYSMMVGFHLFDDKESARAKAQAEIGAARVLLDKQEKELSTL